MKIKVNSVRMVQTEKNPSLRGFASVTIDDLFTVKDVSILEGKNEMFSSMPSYKGKDGEFHSFIGFKEGSTVQKEINKAIVDAYSKVRDGKEFEKTEIDNKTAVEGSKLVKVYAKENGFVNLSYNDVYINGSRIVQGNQGLFMSMPKGTPFQKDDQTIYPDRIYIPNQEARNIIQEKAVKNYEITVSQSKATQEFEGSLDALTQDEETDEEEDER